MRSAKCPDLLLRTGGEESRRRLTEVFSTVRSLTNQERRVARRAEIKGRRGSNSFTSPEIGVKGTERESGWHT